MLILMVIIFLFVGIKERMDRGIHQAGMELGNENQLSVVDKETLYMISIFSSVNEAWTIPS